jgi:hypothetical protein
VDGDTVPDTTGNAGRIEVWYGAVQAPINIAGDFGVWMPGWLGGRWRGLWVAQQVTAPVWVGGMAWRMDIYGRLEAAVSVDGHADILLFFDGGTAAGNVTVVGDLRYYGVTDFEFPGTLSAGSLGEYYNLTTSGLTGPVTVTQNDVDGDTVPDTTGDVGRFEVWYGDVAAGATILIEGSVFNWLWVGRDILADITISGLASWVYAGRHLIDASINPLLATAGTLVRVQVVGLIQSTGAEVIRSQAGTPSYLISDSTWAGTILPALPHVFDGTVVAQIG